MATRKITLKTSRSPRRGTVSRAAIRKAVHVIFGAPTAVQPAQASNARVRRTKKTKAALQA